MKYKIFAFLFIALSVASLSLFYKKTPVKPRVTLITSVYDGDQFIRGFLEDITKQTIFDQCELLMIDANSPGNEEPIIREYMAKYPNIIFVKLDNDPGVYGVWNRGIGMARADLVANVNLDDRSHYQAMEVLVEELEKNPDIDLVYSGLISTPFPNETFLTTLSNMKGDPPEFSIKDMRYCLPGPRPVWRKSFHDRYGYFSEILTSAGDFEMWIRAVSMGSKFKKIPGFYTLYYNNPKGLSTDPDQAKTYHRDVEKALISLRYGHLLQEEG